MTLHDAFTQWRDEIRPHVIAQYGEDDSVALSESWNDYTDALCKDGELTALQYHHCPAYDDSIPEDEDDEREFILSEMGVRLEWREYMKRGDKDSAEEWAQGSRHFKFSLIRGASVYSGWYSMGPALKGVPELQSVLYCLLSDTAEIEAVSDFEEWADSLGYDTDSRKAERIFKACKETHAALSQMFGVQEMEDLRTMFEDF